MSLDCPTAPATHENGGTNNHCLVYLKKSDPVSCLRRFKWLAQRRLSGRGCQSVSFKTSSYHSPR